MALIVNGALWLLLALTTAYGIYHVVGTIRVKMRELEQRDLGAANSTIGRYHPNPQRAARRHSKPA
jgi:hypothetical protein